MPSLVTRRRDRIFGKFWHSGLGRVRLGQVEALVRAIRGGSGGPGGGPGGGHHHLRAAELEEVEASAERLGEGAKGARDAEGERRAALRELLETHRADDTAFAELRCLWDETAEEEEEVADAEGTPKTQ
eukprot:507125-Prorocentrum_minimum.AAC.1